MATNAFIRLVGEDMHNQIKSMYDNTSKGDEFEFIMFSKKNFLTQEKYSNLLKYFNSKTGCTLIPPHESLDISYNQDKETVIRCTINDATKINNIMKKISEYKNHVIFNVLINMWKKDKSLMSFMRKTKEKDNIVNVDELDLRVRLSKEDNLVDVDIKLDETQRDKITYRYKKRTTLMVYGNTPQSGGAKTTKGSTPKGVSKDFIRIDLTYTLTNKSFKHISSSIPNYELEIEFGTDTKGTPELLNKMYSELLMLIKFIQQNNYITINSTKDIVVKQYHALMKHSEKYSSPSLDARQTTTLEIQHIISSIANRYAVTDKADGERSFLMIFDNKVFIITNNLDVKDTGIVIDEALYRYNGTILDGEYVFLEKHNRYLFLAFDCIQHGSVSVKTKQKLFDRLAHIDDIVSNCFILDGQKGFSSKINFDDIPFNMDNYINAYYKDISMYISTLNADIPIKKQFPLIRRKYFIGCLGAKEWEIHAYSKLLYNAYTFDATIKCPYNNDGIIFQPLEQAYITNPKESLRADYKWKPPTQNSIDFYVEFVKDNTNNVLKIYDNSVNSYVRNKLYKICNLFVGTVVQKEEQPVPFKSDMKLNQAYLFVENGEVRDGDGNIINDKTVVEFYYLNDNTIPIQFRWRPIRTRFDKTESVLRFKRKYGNNTGVADRIWRSISNPILMTDIEELAIGGDTYDKKINELKSRISQDLAAAASTEEAYYQKQSNIIYVMRQFHNFIKSALIFTYCHNSYQGNRKLSVFDIGVGRGGDIMKYYRGNIATLVGIDPDRAGLDAPKGPKDRYAGLLRNRHKYPDPPKMYFLQGFGGVPLKYEDQTRACGGMKDDDKKLLETFFGSNRRSMFDVINCQFAIHYMFNDQSTLDNLKNNIVTNLRSGGYIIITTFDAHSVIKLLKDTDEFSAYYINQNKDKEVLFTLRKKYKEPKEFEVLGTGNPVDVYMSWNSMEGSFKTEYLVDKNFITSEFAKVGLTLVDTDTFENQFNIHRDFIVNFSPMDENKENVKYMSNVKNFYVPNDENKASYIYNNLMRYYIFRKNENIQSGGGKEKPLYDFDNPSQFKVINLKNYDPDFSYMCSIHKLLMMHDIIPHSSTPYDFYRDLKIKMLPDIDISKVDIININKSIVVDNSIDGKIKNIIDGLNVFIVERDCNNDYIAQQHSTSSKNAIILMREGHSYFPLIDTQTQKGIFKMSDKLIEWIRDTL